MKTEQLKSKFDLFDYLMYGYSYILEKVETKNGKQKRLKDDELEKSLKEKTKELIKVKDLFVELKLGPSYNRVESPWIQVFSEENRSGTRGRYVGISFVKETNTIELWLGFGKTAKKKREIQELAKGYRIKYSLIEPSLKYGFEYDNDAIVIKKKFKMADFKEDEFDRDLNYITDLYKAYETRFENAMISTTQTIKNVQNKITYEELNERMLTLIEEVGNLAKAIKELGNK